MAAFGSVLRECVCERPLCYWASFGPDFLSVTLLSLCFFLLANDLQLSTFYLFKEIQRLSPKKPHTHSAQCWKDTSVICAFWSCVCDIEALSFKYKLLPMMQLRGIFHLTFLPPKCQLLSKLNILTVLMYTNVQYVLQVPVISLTLESSMTLKTDLTGWLVLLVMSKLDFMCNNWPL